MPFCSECFFTLMLYFGNEEQSEMAKKQLKYILQTRLVNKRYKCCLPINLSQRWAGRSVVGEGSSVSMLATTWNVLVHLGRPVSEFKCIDMLEDFSLFWRANL